VYKIFHVRFEVFHGDGYEEYRLLECRSVFLSLDDQSAVTCLPVIACYSPALKMETIRSSETSVQTIPTPCYIPQDDILQNFSNFDPEYPTSGLTASGLPNLYCNEMMQHRNPICLIISLILAEQSCCA
jgi:hypothetical protein